MVVIYLFFNFLMSFLFYLIELDGSDLGADYLVVEALVLSVLNFL